MGARHIDCTAARTVLADPEGIHFHVMEKQAAHPRAALALDSAQPDRDAEFYSWLTGWTATDGELRSLRHPPLRGPLLELRPELTSKNPTHLDVRLETIDRPDATADDITKRSGRELRPDWGERP